MINPSTTVIERITKDKPNDSFQDELLANIYKGTYNQRNSTVTIPIQLKLKSVVNNIKIKGNLSKVSRKIIFLGDFK